MSKVIVTAALTGVLATREQCPAIPYTPRQIGEEAKRAADAGAAIVHIHNAAPAVATWVLDCAMRLPVRSSMISMVT